MYHGDANERQWQRQWLLAVTSDPSVKGSAKDLEVAGAGLVYWYFSRCGRLTRVHCI